MKNEVRGEGREGEGRREGRGGERRGEREKKGIQKTALLQDLSSLKLFRKLLIH